MPSRIVKQPNGLLAVFSTIVDDFTHYDMTRAEAFAWALELMGRDESEAKIQRGLDDEDPWNGKRGDGLSRWRDALNTIKAVHGEEASRQREEELSRQPA